MDSSQVRMVEMCLALKSTDDIVPEFELALELDSAEVRGVLLFEGEVWGRVVFDFLD